MPPTPSTSAWTWVPQHSLYFNHTTQQWAKPRPDGSWQYSDAAQSQREGGANSHLREGGHSGSDSVKGTKEETQFEEEAQEEGELPPDPELDGEPVSVPYEQQQWPASDADEAPAKVHPPPLLRLIVHTSTLLPLLHIALTDPEDTLLIGRDRSFNKIVRLKEMEVSKSHATVYYEPGAEGRRKEDAQEEQDRSEGGWMVVDNGSTHGTFLTLPEEVKKERLSEPKAASQPYPLSHNSKLSIGSNTFLIHIHSKYPCDSCSVSEDGGNLLPLANDADAPVSDKPSVGYGDGKGVKALTKAEKEAERREKMKGLREAYSLNPPKLAAKKTTKETGGATNATRFVDRAAIRRSLREVPPAHTPLAPSAPALPRPKYNAPEPPLNPFGADSKGAQLLSKLTATEHSNGGGGGGGLGTLIQARSLGGERAGLGSRKMVVVDGEGDGRTGGAGWREEGLERSRKRLKEME